MIRNKKVTLMERTISLLKETNIPVEKITKDTKLSFYWVTRFRRGEFKDPGVNKVECLYDYLSTKKPS